MASLKGLNSGAYRVTNAATLDALRGTVGMDILEAVRIPGATGSKYRVWTTQGTCFDIALNTSPLAKAISTLTGRPRMKAARRNPVRDRART